MMKDVMDGREMSGRVARSVASASGDKCLETHIKDSDCRRRRRRGGTLTKKKRGGGSLIG